METVASMSPESPYKMLLMAALSIPKMHYLLGSSLAVTVFMYNFLEMHFLTDLFSGFKGQPVTLTFGPKNKLYRDVVSKCKVLHGRYKQNPKSCSCLQKFKLCFYLRLRLGDRLLGTCRLHGCVVLICKLYSCIGLEIRPLSNIPGEV